MYTGVDGDTLLYYAQWTDERARQDFARTRRDDRNAGPDAAVPGAVRSAPRPCALYRSGLLNAAAVHARAEVGRGRVLTGVRGGSAAPAGRGRCSARRTRR
ncbi:hypothetical protein GCM10010274_04740 [Streptomyces lavendofoliae]|uniref:ABM domain-containing protein n=1 Tax=Streptomyces lavendofoliae TaxID=67314 RepID=A0A918M1L6_9ACTN|nr:hypothetical protein GCM10010274_04740 [Streptomyces lavendofoliae]